MVVGFTTTYAISAYHHWCCEFESRSGRGVQTNMAARIILYIHVFVFFSVCGKKACHKGCRYDNKW